MDRERERAIIDFRRYGKVTLKLADWCPMPWPTICVISVLSWRDRNKVRKELRRKYPDWEFRISEGIVDNIITPQVWCYPPMK